MSPTIMVVGVVVIGVVYLVATYNGFIVLAARIKEALSNIDVQLKRRADLIPNLVETVKGYAKHEKEVFENVTKARASLMGAGTLQEKAEANNQVTSALKTLFAVAEAYPQLQSSDNFKDLQRQLEDTEDKVAYSRQFYNTNVLEYNTRIQTFPGNILGNMFGFKQYEFFQATEEEKKNVKVQF